MTPFATPDDCLTAFFEPSQAWETYEDGEIDEIANLLKRCAHPGSRCPRTYIVLRTIGELDLLERMLNEGFTDEWFPVEPRGLPSFLSPPIKAKFVQSQNIIFTKSLDLERGSHRHFAPNETLPFDILSRLGSGGYGQVDKIVSKVSFRQYALKRIRRRTAFGNNSKEAMKSFMSEIQIVKSLKHRHVIRYIGSYTDKTYLGLVMSPVADTDLAGFMGQTCVYVQAAAASNDRSSIDRLHDQALAAEMRSTLRTYFGCLAAALTYLHDSLIRHKDIKPQNILVDKGNVLLTDFGLSRDFADDVGSTTSGITPASPRYSPPEVAAYEARNTSADVWSLGCVFFEMVAALCGYDIEWIKRYFGAIHTMSPHFYANPEATSRLVCEWETSWSARDQKPLRWIKGMLQMERRSRPTAARVFELITSPDKLDQNATTFCSICCLPEEETDSCDSLVDEPTILSASRWQSLSSPAGFRLDHHDTPDTQYAQRDYKPIEIAPIVLENPIINQNQETPQSAMEVVLQAQPKDRNGFIPFPYGMDIAQIYDAGQSSPPVLDIDESHVLEVFSSTTTAISSISLAVGYPTLPSVIHSIVNSYNKVLAVAIETDYEWEEISELKDRIANLNKYPSRGTCTLKSNFPDSDNTFSQEDGPTLRQNTNNQFSRPGDSHRKVSDRDRSQKDDSTITMTDPEKQHQTGLDLFPQSPPVHLSRNLELSSTEGEADTFDAKTRYSYVHSKLAPPRVHASSSMPISTHENFNEGLRPKEAPSFAIQRKPLSSDPTPYDTAVKESKPRPKKWFSGWTKRSHKLEKYFQAREKPTRAVFGVSLLTSFEYAGADITMFNEEDQPFIYGHIPIVVARCCEFLKKEGTEAMGCLTTSGDEQRVEDLITILDTAPFTGKSLKWRYTVFDAATTLHRYLTSLPEPLIPNHIADRLITELVARRFMPALPPPQDLNILIKLYKDAIYKLPPLNFQLLMYLLDMFWRFKINAAKNGAYGDVILRYYHTVFFQQVDGSPEVTMEQESAVLFLIDYQARFLYGIPGENGVMPRRTENAMSVQISARWGWGPQRL